MLALYGLKRAYCSYHMVAATEVHASVDCSSRTTIGAVVVGTKNLANASCQWNYFNCYYSSLHFSYLRQSDDH